ncbi:peptidylprolyl isomerase [Polymorphobacter sp.]|uniref:peptidylprolyl isomerase n=1 Tax=Polymorphobacter sp. TaxID=1909290 RepID=UPI003F72CA25
MVKALLLAMMMQAGVAAPPVVAPVSSLPHVKVVTGAGEFTLRLERDKAPLTVANFLRYVDQKRFDGTVFYRAMMVGEAGQFGLIQGGTQGNSKRVLPPVKHEPTSATGLSNTDMAISMARGAPGSANGDFFIIIGDLSSLDATEADPGFAAFGKVVAGREVVKAIQAAPVSATLGEGAMKGQMIEKPVPIVRMVRTLPVPNAEPDLVPEAASIAAEPAAAD